MSLVKKTSRFHRTTQKNLDKRPSEVVPVGAWVELCPNYDTSAYEAVQAARHEEERLQRLQAEKEQKLARFRQEVRSRVRELQKLKRQEQLQESFQAVNLHGRVLQRTAPSANRLSQRKDACLYQSSDPHAIGHSVQHDHSQASVSAGSGDAGRSPSGHLVMDCAGQTRRLIQRAKQDLAAKQLAIKQRGGPSAVPGGVWGSSQGDPSAVPGGVWGSSFTRDKPSAVRETGDAVSLEPGSEVTVETGITRHHTIPLRPIEGALYDDGSESSEHRLPFDPHRTGNKHVTFAPGVHRSPQVISKVKGHDSRDDFSLDLDHGETNGLKDMIATDSGQRIVDVYGRRAEVRGLGGDCERVKGHHVPEVNPGVVAEELKRQHGVQLSMFRRLYSDMEREQVREKDRKRSHQKKIQELKRGKERERCEAERQAQLMVQPVDMLAGSEDETRQREEEEAEIQRLQARLRQKNKETKRFIRALRAMMKERIALLGVNPPPLCACGPTVWDANPETCANNCIFYKNPKAYARALASVLAVESTG